MWDFIIQGKCNMFAASPPARPKRRNRKKKRKMEEKDLKISMYHLLHVIQENS